MAKLIYAPDPSAKLLSSRQKIFLAGSIEMGTAENWQDKVIMALSDLNIEILNPRRTDWDASWEQSIDNPKFKEQVDWELDNITNADFVLMYFDPKTKSPISLLELGILTINHPVVIVCCPQGFWRKGNVDIVCDRYEIPVFENLDDAIHSVKLMMQEMRDV